MVIDIGGLIALALHEKLLLEQDFELEQNNSIGSWPKNNLDNIADL